MYLTLRLVKVFEWLSIKADTWGNRPNFQEHTSNFADFCWFKMSVEQSVRESVEPDLVSDNLLVRLFATAQALLFYRFKAEIGKFFASVAFQN